MRVAEVLCWLWEVITSPSQSWDVLDFNYLSSKGQQLVIVVWRRVIESPWKKNKLAVGVDGVEELDFVL